jgi:hypothetical protein
VQSGLWQGVAKKTVVGDDENYAAFAPIKNKPQPPHEGMLKLFRVISALLIERFGGRLRISSDVSY